MKTPMKGLIASHDMSVKKVMRLIDRSGFRMAYVIDGQRRLLGVVSDSEIRKAILKGHDIEAPVRGIVNPKPVVLNEKDLKDQYAAHIAAKELLGCMPDSRYLLVVDARRRPKKLIACADLIGPGGVMKVRRAGPRSVLTVGGAGYLGSVLARRLLSRGFRVKVLDNLAFGIEPIRELLKKKNFELVQGDMRNISTITRMLEGVDAVVNLAAVVGDPACKNWPEATIETNYLANKVLAEACRFHQINRFVYASTCSVYGASQSNRALDERSNLNPVSFYARSKIQSEEAILSMVDENFSPTILRMGTLYGYSPRMRFDLVLNAMTKSAVTEGRIIVHGSGKQWRPLLHVEDAAEAYLRCLETPIHKVRGEVFNVGSQGQNRRVIDIAKEVHRRIPRARLIVQGEGADPRDYAVSFAKIENVLKFKVKRRIGPSVDLIKSRIEDGTIADVNDSWHYNMEAD